MRAIEWMRRLVADWSQKRRRKRRKEDPLLPRLTMKRLEERRVLNADAAPAEVLLIDAGDAADDGQADTYEFSQEDDQLHLSVNGEQVFSGSVDQVSEIVVQGSSDNDIVVADLLANVHLRFDGAEGHDHLQLQGGESVSQVDYEFTGAYEGQIEAHASEGTATTLYQSVEGINDQLTAASRSFQTGPTSHGISINESEAHEGVTELSLDAGQGVSIEFVNPTDSLTINTDGSSLDADLVQVGGLGDGFNADLNLSGSANDAQHLHGDINLGSGDLHLSGGTIHLSGELTSESANFSFSAAKQFVVESSATLTNHNGQIEANAQEISHQGDILSTRGFVHFDSGETGQTLIEGLIDVSTRQEGEVGGTVQLLGLHVGLLGAARIDASGAGGGGRVLVGGDYQGANPAIRNAQRSYLGTNSAIRADALVDGEGGEIIIWSDEVTQVAGTLSARGGALSGDGGFIETSGLRDLQFSGAVDASAPNGVAGTWLLDPTDITIDGGPTDGDLEQNTTGGTLTFSEDDNTLDSASIAASDIETALEAGTNVVVTTTSTANGTNGGRITVASSIQPSLMGGGAQDVTLTLNADENIVINGGVTIDSTANGSDKFSLILQATGDITNSGTINLTGGMDGDLTASGVAISLGSIDVGSGAIAITNSGASSINVTDAGSLTKDGAGTLGLTAAAAYTGTTTISAGRVNVTGTIEGDVSIEGGTLGGTGTVNGTVTMTNAGGSVSPGTSPGQITFADDVTFHDNGSFDVELDGTTPGTQHDQIVLTGNNTTTTTLDGTLNVQDNLGALATGDFVIIDNTNGATISGTFNNAPTDGGLVTGASIAVTIDYDGGDGDDVVLSLSSTQTFDGDGNDNTFIVDLSGGNLRVRQDAVTVLDVAIGLVTSLNINGAAGSDTLIVDHSGGFVDVDITYDGGESGGDNDVLSVIGDAASDTAVYTPSNTVANSGSVVVNDDGGATQMTVNFSNLEPLDISGMATATISSAGAVDVWTLTDGMDTTMSVNALVVSGTSDAVAIESAHFFSNTTVVVDADTDAQVDTITVASATVGFTNLTIESGGTIDGTTDDATAEISGGIVTLNAGAGGIGNSTILDVTATTSLNADTSTAGSNITIDSIGDLLAGLITAGAGNVTLDSTGAIDSVTDDATADVVGAAINLIAASGGIGVTSDLDVTATTSLSADTTADNANIIIDSIGFLPVGLIDAGMGDVTLDSTASITSFAPDGTADVSGATVNLTAAASGIGDTGELLDITATTLLNADTSADNSNLFIESIGNLTAGLFNAGGGNVEVHSTGAINDGNAGANNFLGAGLTLSAANGIGAAGNFINSTVTSLQATNSTSGGIFVQESNGLQINGTGVRTLAGNGAVNVDVDAGALTVNSVVTAHGSGAATLNADTGTITTSAVVSSTTGAVSVTGNVVNQNANISTGGTGTIGVTADTGAITMMDGVSSTAGSGDITYNAQTSVALSSLSTSGNAMVTATTTAITDNLTGEGSSNENISATGVTLNAVSGIGAGTGVLGEVEDLDINAGTLTATNTTSNEIQIFEVDSVALNLISNGTRAVVIDAGGTISDNNAAVNNIAAGDAILRAVTGIGAAGVGLELETTVTNLTTTTTGAAAETHIVETDGLTTLTVTTNDGDVDIDFSGAAHSLTFTAASDALNFVAPATAVDFTNSSTGIVLTGASSATTASLTAGTAITDTTGVVSATSLSTTSDGGTTLDNTHAVDAYTAVNTTSGPILFTNAAPSGTLDLQAITQAAGGANPVTINETGAISVSGALNAANNTATLNAGSTIVDTTGVITAALLDTTSDGGTTLDNTHVVEAFAAANTTGGAILLNNNTAGGALDLQAITQAAGGANSVTINETDAISSSGALNAADNSVILNADMTITDTTGVITAALLNTTSDGGTTLDSTHVVEAFTAVNTTGGAIQLNNNTAGGMLDLQAITQAAGGVNPVTINETDAISSSGALNAADNTATLNAGMTISDAAGGLVTAGLLNTTSDGGTTLNTTTHVVEAFSSTNTTGGAILLTNNTAGGTLDIQGITQAAGGGNAVTITETDAVSFSGLLDATDNTATLNVGDNIIDNDAATDINAANALLDTGSGVGASGAGILETSVGNLEADGGTGGVFLVNDEALEIGGVGGLTGVSATSDVDISTSTGSGAAITVSETVSSSSASVDLDAEGVLTITDNVEAVNGNIVLGAGVDGSATVNDFIFTSGVLMSSGGDVSPAFFTIAGGTRFDALDGAPSSISPPLTNGETATIDVIIGELAPLSTIQIGIDWREYDSNVSTSQLFDGMSQATIDSDPTMVTEANKKVQINTSVLDVSGAGTLIDPFLHTGSYEHIFNADPDPSDPSVVHVAVRISEFAGGAVDINLGTTAITAFEQPGALTNTLGNPVLLVGSFNSQIGIMVIISLDVLELAVGAPPPMADPLPTTPAVLVNVPGLPAPVEATTVISLPQALPNTAGITAQGEVRYYELRIVELRTVERTQELKLTESPQERINLNDPRLKSISPFDPSKLPELFKRLPGDRYRIYLIEDGAERLMIEFVIEKVGDEGRPIELPERVEADPQGNRNLDRIINRQAVMPEQSAPEKTASEEETPIGKRLSKASFVSSGGLIFGAALLAKPAIEERRTRADRRMAKFKNHRFPL